MLLEIQCGSSLTYSTNGPNFDSCSTPLSISIQWDNYTQFTVSCILPEVRKLHIKFTYLIGVLYWQNLVETFALVPYVVPSSNQDR